jgi:hypothetical protein
MFGLNRLARSISLFDRVIQTSGYTASGHHALGTMEARLRTGVLQVLVGERSAKVVLDAVVED